MTLAMSICVGKGKDPLSRLPAASIGDAQVDPKSVPRDSRSWLRFRIWGNFEPLQETFGAIAEKP